MDRTNNSRRIILICVLLAVVTSVCFWPMLSNGFINFDDPEYITENPNVTSGLTWENVAWAFRTGHAGNWHPLTWLSHMLDAQLFGVKPQGHHLTNLLLHVANTLLLFIILHKMTGTVWRSGFVAALFALHPLHVESVAWASERKDVLSALFFLLTLWAYADHARKSSSELPLAWGSWWRFRPKYFLALVFFALGLMSKPMVVTLPFLLLLLDFWPMQRVSFQKEASSGSRSQQKTPVRIVPLMLEKVPFFALAIAASLVTYWVQKKQGAVSTLSGLPLECRVSNAIASFLRYVGKTVWPTKLAPFYPHPDTTYPVSEQWPFWQIASAAAVLVLVSLLVLRLYRSKPYLLTGWFWYLGMLVPVIGLVQVGSQGMADRYTYLPLIGLFIAGTWLVADTLAAPGKSSLPWAVSASAILAACAGLTWVQLHRWHDSIKLFEHTLAVTTKNPTAHFNLGAAWETEGKLGIALAHYRAALQLDPSYADARYNIGHALAAQGKFEEAAAEYRAVLEMHPEHLFAHNNLGNALLSLGKTAEAEKEYRESLRLRSDYAAGHNNLGKVLADQGRFAEASEQFAEALRLKPDYVEAQSGLALTLAAQGRHEEALFHWQRVALAKPGKAEVQVNLGNVLTEMGKLEEARAAYALAVKLEPDLERQTLELGDHLSARGQWDPAKARFILATRLNPQSASPHERLGRLLARQGYLNEAIDEFREVVRLRPDAQAFYNLGLAYVMQSKMELAIPQYRKALELKADWPEPLNDLAWILATDYRAALRNGTEAVRLATEACRLSGGREARFSGTLDAAYAETGDFEKAIATARQTELLAVNAGQTNLASAARQRLELYQLQQPFRQKCPPSTERSAPN